jgi:hypothetical protein
MAMRFGKAETIFREAFPPTRGYSTSEFEAGFHPSVVILKNPGTGSRNVEIEADPEGKAIVSPIIAYRWL